MILMLYFRNEKSLLKLLVAARTSHIGIAVIIIRNWLNRKSMTKLIGMDRYTGTSGLEISPVSGLNIGGHVYGTNAIENNLDHLGEICIR